MLDTMTVTKILGGFCGALLVFLLGAWAADTIYSRGQSDGYDQKQAYSIEVEGGESVQEEQSEPEIDYAALFASADPADGETLFNRQCSACHVLASDGPSKPGPYLGGVVGRNVGAVEGFNYSGALVAVNDVWTPEELVKFLESPRSYAPGTAMGYNGMRKPEDRASLVLWLEAQAN